MVVHDRGFLDTVTTDIIHMHYQRLDNYCGNYSVSKLRSHDLGNLLFMFVAIYSNKTWKIDMSTEGIRSSNAI